MHRVLGLALVAIVILFAGCGGGGGRLVPNGSQTASVWPEGGRAVTSQIDSSRMLSWQEIKEIPVGTIMYLRVNRQGTEVRQYEVRFNGFEESYGERLIACTVLGKLGIGAGDSGSPILTADNRLVGGLCYGLDGDNKSFLARAAIDIKAAAGELSSTRSVVSAFGNHYQAIEPVHYIKGFNSRMAQRMGLPVPEGYRLLDGLSGTSAVNRSAITLSKLVPGQSVSISEISGDLMTGGVIGTYTFSEGDNYFIFAHAYNQEGDISSPFMLAKMVMMWDSQSWGSYKEAEPIGSVIGTAIIDRRNGVVVTDRSGYAPRTFSVDVHVSINGGAIRDFHHNITAHHNNDLERYFTLGAIFISIDHAYDKITSGTASGTLEITYQGGKTQQEVIDLPGYYDDMYNDITSEVTNAIDTLLDYDLMVNESPVKIELTVNVNDQNSP